jgi:hypothetical protein
MEADEKTQSDATAHTLHLLNESLLRREDQPVQIPAPGPDSALRSTTATDPQSLRPSHNNSLKNNLLIQQCSNTKKASLSVTVHDCSACTGYRYRSATAARKNY